jgi:hypothetical protein
MHDPPHRRAGARIAVVACLAVVPLGWLVLRLRGVHPARPVLLGLQVAGCALLLGLARLLERR